MSEVKSGSRILDVIKRITSNRESGRLEIGSPDAHSSGTHSSGTHGCGTHGVLLFVDGKLVDARLESLSGFQAVNAAVALRDVEFSFDHVVPAPQAVSITPSERVVLKRFFGIEAADMQEPVSLVEAETGWTETPEQVVPLTEVEELPQTDLEETPTVEVAAVHPAPVLGAQQSGNIRRFGFLLRPQIAAVLVLLLVGVIAGAITLRSKFKARQQATQVASVVASGSPSTSDVSVKTEQVSSAAPASVEPERRESVSVKPAPRESASIKAAVKPVPGESPALAVSQPTNEVRDLSGEWQLINTVQKTGYRSFNQMQVGFRLKIAQKGAAFTGKGEKFSENGQTLPANSRTPIQVTGSIDGDKVVATFIEDGKMRRTSGRFVWTLQSSGGLTGTFVSTAANSSGASAVTKQ